MSFYIDLKFAQQAAYIYNAKDRGGYKFQFRCPLCGDSKHSKLKARGWFIPNIDQTRMNYKCWNCNASMHISSFLSMVNSPLNDQYQLEKFIDNNKKKEINNQNIDELFIKQPEEIENIPQTEISKENKILEKCTKLSSLPDGHICKQYCNKRLIPTSAYDFLYFHNNFSGVFLGKEDIKEDQRLLLPFFDKNNILLAIQGRSLNPISNMRYITYKINTKAVKIFGLDRFDFQKPGYVVEGPIDSLFINNCLAVAGSDLVSSLSKIDHNKEQFTMIHDNQKTTEICDMIENSIKHGYKVVIFPKNLDRHKDINDLVLAGKDINKIIAENTYQGLKAMVALSRWKNN